MIRYLFAIAAMMFAAECAAHTVSTARVHLEGRSVEIDVAAADLATLLAIDADGDGALRWREVEAARDEVERALSRAVTFEAAGSACALAPEALGLRRYADGAAISLRATLDCDPTSVTDGPLLADDGGHRTLVGVGERGAVVLSAAQPTAALDGTGRSGFTHFFAEGVHHLLIGYDHLAFLLTLLLPMVIARGGGTTTLRGAVVRAAAVITAFTLAHSLTLAVAALDLATPSSRLIEATIAASVVVAAINNLGAWIDRRLWLVAAVFGLIHGFGFAGALSALGLPGESRVVALLAFNLGVEAGQLAVAAIALPVLHLAARSRHYRAWVVVPASLAVAAVGLYWLVERLA